MHGFFPTAEHPKPACLFENVWMNSSGDFEEHGRELQALVNRAARQLGQAHKALIEARKALDLARRLSRFSLTQLPEKRFAESEL